MPSIPLTKIIDGNRYEYAPETGGASSSRAAASRKATTFRRDNPFYTARVAQVGDNLWAVYCRKRPVRPRNPR